jgi:integrase
MGGIMPKVSMTDQWLKKLKPQETQVDYFDKTLPGLGLRVGKSGKKTWIVMYRVKGHKKKHRLTLKKKYPQLSLKKAREKASSILVKADEGHDPAGEKQKLKKAPTFKNLANEYLEKWAAIKKRSVNEDRRIIAKDLIPSWGSHKAQDIKRRDVKRLLVRIVDRGAPIQANRTLALTRKIFNWGISEDLVEENPCLQIKMPGQEHQRDRVFSENEIKALWGAFEQLGPTMEPFFKLRLVTAQRGGEVMTMQWRDVDLDSGWWTIPAEHSKNGLPHRVPLSKLALDILKQMQAISGNDKWVFPSPRKSCSHIKNVQKTALRIREYSDVSDFKPHDLRRTAASLMTSMGILRLTVSKILNHVEQGVTRVYDRYSYDREKRAALDRWARRLEQILTGKKAKVVNIR